jgi:F-type H+-transporting ATPase subunit b
MLESLGFSSVTFVVTIINIAILCVILRAVLFKPVTKFMAERARKIQNAIDQAERNKAQANMLLEQYEARLKTAGDEAEAIITAARETAEAEAARIVAEGKAAAEAHAANTRRQLESERQAVFARFKLEAAALVVAASARLTQRELAGEDNRRFAAMLLEELSVQSTVAQSAVVQSTVVQSTVVQSAAAKRNG